MSGKESIKIMVLEDDDDDFRIILRQLRNDHCAFDVDRTNTLTTALEQVDRQAFDLILSDLNLPDSTGLQTVARLRERCGATPIIVLTSLDDASLESDILEVGAQDYLVKGELPGRVITRALLHAVHRQRALNEVNLLVARLEESQRELEKKNQRLQQLYKTAHEFVDNVSHDFRTPLTVISDYVTIIREGMVGSINGEQRKMLEKVSVRADDLNNMVDDLLDISKLDSGLLGAWLRHVDVAEVINRSESLLLQRAQVRNVEFIVDCEADLPAVYCDAEKVGRVIMNLAVNAIKFCGDDGRVRLWTQTDPVGAQIEIGVTDNGPGIDEQQLEQVVQRFQQGAGQLQTTVKGFGLGLSIAQQLCRLNLGELSVQSRVGEGSTFSFTLPIDDPSVVMRRWLEFRQLEGELLQVIEISVDDDVASKAADEFGSFLNCLLRRDDLLFRMTRVSWLLAQAMPPTDSDRWFHRAQTEFAQTNRNRPLGPLPDYQTAIRRRWRPGTPHDAILAEFDATVRHSAAALSKV